jgi:hypothetical protein
MEVIAMRKAVLLLAVFGLVGALWAADPATGTWKLNLAKSKFVSGIRVPVKEETMVIREVGDKTENTTTGVRTDGSIISTKWAAPKQGGVLTDQQPPAPKGEIEVFTVIDDFNVYFTVLQNGKQVGIDHCVITKDAKTMNCASKGTDAKGKPFEEISVFEKQ